MLLILVVAIFALPSVSENVLGVLGKLNYCLHPLGLTLDFLYQKRPSKFLHHFQAHPAHFLMVGLLLGIAYSMYNSNRDLTNKLGVLLILVVAIFALPSVSEMWSKEVDKLTEGPGDWNDDWPDSWKETQVVVFELPDGEVAIGGLTGYENVEQLTDAAALELGLTIEKESYSLGEMVVSIDGHELEGWEFTLDGERTPVGISQAEVGEDSVVRWSAA